MPASSLFFSICVPSRNRAETLLYCLKTLLHQNFDSYEIIVSNNSDEGEESEKTLRAVQSLRSDKIKYHRPSTVLSMTDNYEFALSKTCGKYVLCIGDDDGLMVDSLQYVQDLIIKYDAKFIKGPVVWYHWKNSPLAPNTMNLPYVRPLTKVDSRSILEKVARFELGYFSLPMIYYGFVCREIIDKVVAVQGSFFQNAASIDMYSGLVIAHHISEFVVSDQPFVIAGVSGKSNGAAEQKSLTVNISKEHYAKTGIAKMYEVYKVPQLQQHDLQLLSLLELTKFAKNFNLSYDEVPINAKKVIIKFLSNNPVINNISDLGKANCFRDYDIYNEDIEYVKNNFFGKEAYFLFLGEDDLQTVQYKSINPDLFAIEDVYDASVASRKLIDGYQHLIPASITVSKVEKTGSLKRAYRRIKRSGKVLLLGHE